MKCRLMDRAPTLFLAECFFVYLDKSAVYSILTQIQSHFELATCIVCDHLNTDPRFGSVMIRNLAVTLIGIHLVATTHFFAWIRILSNPSGS
jgi:hypothetical protein